MCRLRPPRPTPQDVPKAKETRVKSINYPSAQDPGYRWIVRATSSLGPVHAQLMGPCFINPTPFRPRKEHETPGIADPIESSLILVLPGIPSDPRDRLGTFADLLRDDGPGAGLDGSFWWRPECELANAAPERSAVLLRDQSGAVLLPVGCHGRAVEGDDAEAGVSGDVPADPVSRMLPRDSWPMIAIISRRR